MIINNNLIEALKAFDDALDGNLACRNDGYTYTVSCPPYCCETKCDDEGGEEEKENNFPDQVFFDDILDDVKHVIYNDPATIVTFKDGTKVCVKTCSSDKFDKEIGLVYALVKRLYADDVDENGYLKATGLGEKIRKIVKDGFDQKEQARKRKAKKDAARAAKKQNEENPAEGSDE